MPRFLIAVILCFGVAGAAAAATAPFKQGKYKGTTGQLNPSKGRNFPLTFTVANGKISKVRTTTRDKCPDGTYLRVDQGVFPTVRLDSKGRFTLRAGPKEQPAVMRGRVSGSTASGTIIDRNNDTAGSGVCKASTTWTAKLVK